MECLCIFPVFGDIASCNGNCDPIRHFSGVKGSRLTVMSGSRVQERMLSANQQFAIACGCEGDRYSINPIELIVVRFLQFFLNEHY